MAHSKGMFFSLRSMILQVFLVVFSLLLPPTWALTTTLPDGRIVRVPALKPLSQGANSTLPVTHIHLAKGRHPKPKPKSPTGPFANPQDTRVRLNSSMCGLDRPTKENWDRYLPELGPWILNQFEDYKMSDDYQSFPLFLRDRWAPNLVSSSLYCDSIGACSIVSCESLIEDDGTNHHDRQMALLAFEQLANAAHLFQAMEKEVAYAINKIKSHSNTYIEEFSSAPRIEKALQDDLKKEEFAMQVFVSLGLVASGFFGTFETMGVAGGKTAAPFISLLTNIFVGISGIRGQFRNPTEIVKDLKLAISSDLNLVLEKVVESIEMDFHDLMIGGEDHLGRTVVDLMSNSGFLEPNPDFMPKLGQHIGRTVLGTAIDKMWKFDRAYFLMVENPGGCEQEKTKYVRGPTDVLVCLPEHDDKGYWFYSIDRALEKDFWRTQHAKTRGPTGYWRLNGSDKYFGITLQDVARSSYHNYQIDTDKIKDKKLQFKDAKLLFDPLTINNWIRSSNEQNRMLGVFTVAICNNPGGEGISGILDKKGLNYPCMCGGNPWNGVGYDPKKNEMGYFLPSTGFSMSEDFQHYCSHKNNCEEDDKVDIRPQLEAVRDQGGFSLSVKIDHPYKKCKKRLDSKKHPGFSQKDRDNKTKRNRIDWAVHDELKRNTSRAVVPFES